MSDASATDRPKLKLLPVQEYAGVDSDDPLRFYFRPMPTKKRTMEMRGIVSFQGSFTRRVTL